MTQSQHRTVLIVAALMACVGCGGEPRGGPRKQTFPLTGLVLVDDQPAAGVQVRCVPQGIQPVPTTIAGYTDESGEFSIGTYEADDGIPAGNYKLVFVWGQWNLSGQYGGPDRLNGRYEDVESSPMTVAVGEGQPADVGVITLTSKE